MGGFQSQLVIIHLDFVMQGNTVLYCCVICLHFSFNNPIANLFLFIWMVFNHVVMGMLILLCKEILCNHKTLTPDTLISSTGFESAFLPHLETRIIIICPSEKGQVGNSK